MGKKKEYKEANRRFLKNLSFQEGVFALPCGIYYTLIPQHYYKYNFLST